MEQLVQSALTAEAERVDVDVDALWRRVEPAIGAKPTTRRTWIVAGAAAAALLLVIGVVLLSTPADDPRTATPPVASSPSTMTPSVAPTTPRVTDRFAFNTSYAGRGPIPLDARRIDGRLVRGEVVLFDVRPGMGPTARGPEGPIYSYAYACTGLCVTRVHTGAVRSMDTFLVGRYRPGHVVTEQWPRSRGSCCVSLTAFAGPRGAMSATLAYSSGPTLEAQRLRGEGWPFSLFVALGPPGGVFGPRSGGIEIELRNGGTVGVQA